ncbi:hypothetical protein K8I85_06425 [bacterium]|nr:hypothetical protein [bacterium]
MLGMVHNSFRSAAAALLLAGALAAPASAAQVVIANQSVPMDTVATESLRRVFLGTTTKVDGQKVGIAVLADGETHSGFLTSYLHRNPKQFLSHWRRICFSGKGTLPPTFQTEAELVAHVAATPGAIGYVDADTPLEGVKRITVRD